MKYLVPRISQEIFVFPSEYFIYSTFHALFWRALWLCEVKAQMFCAPHLSEDLICQAAECHELPLTQKEFRTSCTFSGWSPRWLMSKPLQEPRASKREPGFATPVRLRRRPSIPLTGVGFGNAELYNGFRSVQKGPTDPKGPCERQGTTVQHNARCYDEAWTAWYTWTSGCEAHFKKNT